MPARAWRARGAGISLQGLLTVSGAQNYLGRQCLRSHQPLQAEEQLSRAKLFKHRTSMRNSAIFGLKILIWGIGKGVNEFHTHKVLSDFGAICFCSRQFPRRFCCAGERPRTRERSNLRAWPPRAAWLNPPSLTLNICAANLEIAAAFNCFGEGKGEGE